MVHLSKTVYLLPQPLLCKKPSKVWCILNFCLFSFIPHLIRKDLARYYTHTPQPSGQNSLPLPSGPIKISPPQTHNTSHENQAFLLQSNLFPPDLKIVYCPTRLSELFSISSQQQNSQLHPPAVSGRSNNSRGCQHPEASSGRDRNSRSLGGQLVLRGGMCAAGKTEVGKQQFKNRLCSTQKAASVCTVVYIWWEH